MLLKKKGDQSPLIHIPRQLMDSSDIRKRAEDLFFFLWALEYREDQAASKRQSPRLKNQANMKVPKSAGRLAPKAGQSLSFPMNGNVCNSIILRRKGIYI